MWDFNVTVSVTKQEFLAVPVKLVNKFSQLDFPICRVGMAKSRMMSKKEITFSKPCQFHRFLDN